VKDFDAEVRRCLHIIKGGYEYLSIIPHATVSREYVRERDGTLSFTNIYLRHLVPKVWFTDPATIPDVFCSELGRHVAIGEESFLVKTLRDSSAATPFAFQVESLRRNVRDFMAAGHANPVVFAPIEFFTTLAINEAVAFGFPHNLLLDGREIPLFYSSNYVKFSEFIIVDKGFGVWIFERGNVNDTLKAEINPAENDPDNVDVLVVSKVFYQIENPRAIKMLAPTAQQG
jgi:hypothetical protein